MANRVDPSHLLELQKHVDRIRNFCILAHVDHGKTTLSDSLVSSNGFISSRLAGKLRFLDSTEEEQKRGITMHSSAIALLFQMEEKGQEQGKGSEGNKEEFLVNLVDSPGHIDFSSDVSTAARLCDGALVIVDVLEGVCTQTHAVIYKALRERMKPCLVLNKIDRLIVETRLSPSEAFHHLRRLIENVNALAYTLVKSELLKKATEADPNLAEFVVDDNEPLVNEWTFAAEKGNVQFASALDGWGFGLMKFINILIKKLSLNRNILRQYLFEDYYLNLDSKKIGKVDNSDMTKQPMFASLVLEPIWELYDLAMNQNDIQQLVQVAKEKHNISLLPKEINARDIRSTLQCILRKWLPLADSILRMVVRNMPSPREAQEKRAETLISSEVLTALNNPTNDKLLAIDKIYRDIKTCNTEESSSLVVFISKMVPVRVAELYKRDVEVLNMKRARELGEGFSTDLKPDAEVFMAVGRVFAGRLGRNSELFIIGHKVDVLQGEVEIEQSSEREALSAQKIVKVFSEEIGCYIMLGPSVYPAEGGVWGGNIVGIVGLDSQILKTATLSSSPACFPLKPITFQAKPMLKVAVEPLSHKELKSLERGLECLNQYDPVVEVALEENGQWTMTCLGELHLDQCVKALTDKFMKSEVKVSEPLISFRETIIPFPLASPSSLSSPNPTSTPSSSSLLENETALSRQLPAPWCELPHLHRSKGGRIRLVPEPQNPNLALTLHTIPLPKAAACLESLGEVVQRLEEYLAGHYLHDQTTPLSLSSLPDQLIGVGKSLLSKIKEEREEVKASQNSIEIECMEETIRTLVGDKSLESVVEGLLSIGPRLSPTNMLLFSPTTIFEIYPHTISTEDSPSSSSKSPPIAKLSLSSSSLQCKRIWRLLHSAVTAGFQEAMLAGPLMGEPCYCIGVIVEKVEVSNAIIEQIFSAEERSAFYTIGEGETAGGGGIEEDLISISSTQTDRLANVPTGQLISEVKDHIRLALLSCPIRIVEAIYQCDLQCDQSQLGNLYAVLSRRRGVMYKEDIIEGTSLFLLSAYLPVVQSFQFSQELLKKTSGSGTAPQLSFSHWQILVQDPFWRPRTEEELEEFGEGGEQHNVSRLWVNKVRKRKGLATDEQVVVFAEKQRTLNKKK